LALFEAWTGAMMAPWMALFHGAPWGIGNATSTDDGAQAPFPSPLAFTPLGALQALAPGLSQALGAANQTAEALTRAMAEAQGGPVHVNVIDTDGPFAIHVSISVGGQRPADPQGPIIDHDPPNPALPPK
jgi:hypothetical protein